METLTKNNICPQHKCDKKQCHYRHTKNNEQDCWKHFHRGEPGHSWLCRLEYKNKFRPPPICGGNTCVCNFPTSMAHHNEIKKLTKKLEEAEIIADGLREELRAKHFTKCECCEEEIAEDMNMGGCAGFHYSIMCQECAEWDEDEEEWFCKQCKFDDKIQTFIEDTNPRELNR